MSTSPPLPPERRWVPGPLPEDVERALLRMRKLPDVQYVAVMPDVHLAREVCVGTVLATSRLVYPAAVGGDIGCGLAAVAFDRSAADVLHDAAAARRVLAGLRAAVPTNRHRGPRPLPKELADATLSDPRLESMKRRDARVQLGTLGRGNHFLELQADDEDDGRLWLMVHSGSRAVGQAIRDHHVSRAGPGPGIVGLDGDAAAAYFADAVWARKYADANRRAMIDAASSLLGSLFSAHRLDETFATCDHNHVRREPHFGQEWWVHRKGAASARAGETGVIPGSMGTVSYLAEGRGNPDSLCSSSHGAGRAMSRDEARRRVSARELARQLRGVWFDDGAAMALREEAPSAYKDIGKVMRAQRDLVRVVRKLRAVLSYKGP